MSNVLVIGAIDDIANGVEAANGAGRRRLRVTRRTWPDVKRRRADPIDADVLVVDLTGPNASTARLRRMQDRNPRMLLVLQPGTDLTRTNALTRLLDRPNVDFVRSNADANEVRFRVRRLLGLPSVNFGERLPISRLANGSQLVPALHNLDNGRIDAGRVAEFFGIPLADVARSLGASLSSVHKTPASRSLQEGLYQFERIAVALLALAASKENARIWMNLPEPQLEDQTPMDVAREGLAHVVAEMLEDMLFGHPS